MNHFFNSRRQAIHLILLFALALTCCTSAKAAQTAPCHDAARFALDEDEATDRTTGLVWKRCSAGLEWLGAKDGCGGEIAVVNPERADDIARKAGAGWRLPTADELLSLVARACGEPAIDRQIFPDVPLDPGGEGSLYWTTTPAGMLDMMVTVDFRDGTYDMHSRGLNYYVRLVKSAPR